MALSPEDEQRAREMARIQAQETQKFALGEVKKAQKKGLMIAGIGMLLILGTCTLGVMLG